MVRAGTRGASRHGRVSISRLSAGHAAADRAEAHRKKPSHPYAGMVSVPAHPHYHATDSVSQRCISHSLPALKNTLLPVSPPATDFCIPYMRSDLAGLKSFLSSHGAPVFLHKS